jgi:hypothetical protein
MTVTKRSQSHFNLGWKVWLGIVMMSALLLAAAALGVVIGILDKD